MGSMRVPVASFVQQAGSTPVEGATPANVFVVSSNPRLRESLQSKLGHLRWNVIEAGSGAGALEMLYQHGNGDGVLLLDPVLPDLDPGEFRKMIERRFPNTRVITMNPRTGQLLVGDVPQSPVAKWLLDLVNVEGPVGACASATGGVATGGAGTSGDGAGVVGGVGREAPYYARSERSNLRGMVGGSAPMQRIYELVRMVAVRDTTVLVTGESGTGKDLVAQEIHQISPRRKQPFVVLNCSAIPESLLEAELFGYAKGAFTGAVQSRIGRIHAAHGGTLFLDEIGDMPLSLQSKLLRFLEQGEVQRLGGNDNLKVDVRVVAATNVNLKKQVENRLFRDDLYYRLAVFPIQLPPLRERLGDLEGLAAAFIQKFHPGKVLSVAAQQMLEVHSWPGNVRELRNVMERATILAGPEQEIGAEHIVL